MRDMETCRAEVFRRSRERIRERNRRRRGMSAVCMSLALCLLAGALTIYLRPPRDRVKADGVKADAPMWQQNEAPPDRMEEIPPQETPHIEEPAEQSTGEKSVKRSEASQNEKSGALYGSSNQWDIDYKSALMDGVTDGVTDGETQAAANSAEEREGDGLMKRNHILSICALALCTALCIAAVALWPRRAAVAQTPGDTGAEGEEQTVQREKGMLVGQADFTACTIRAGAYREDAAYPTVKIIRSVKALEAYHRANWQAYGTAELPEECRRYDENYFRDRVLLIVAAPPASSSVRYRVTEVMCWGGEMDVHIQVETPQVCTADLAPWHILIELQAEADVADESRVQLDFYDEETYAAGGHESWRAVTAGEASGCISLRLPDDWRYEVEDCSEGMEPFDIAIRIAPPGQEGGYPIAVCREKTPAVGVCGTGLTSRSVVLGENKGWKGTYGRAPVWDFIVLGEMQPGRCVILNEGFDETWWARHGQTTMEILSTLTLGSAAGGEEPGNRERAELTEDQILELATAAVTVPYDYVEAAYDESTGQWSVHFGQNGVVGGGQTVTLDAYGTLLDSVYGE